MQHLGVGCRLAGDGVTPVVSTGIVAPGTQAQAMSAPDFDAIALSSRHGSRSMYKSGCRCDDCRAANASYHGDAATPFAWKQPTPTPAQPAGSPQLLASAWAWPRCGP